MQAPVDHQLVERQAKLITLRLKINVNASAAGFAGYWSGLQIILLNNPASAEQVFNHSIQYDFEELVKVCLSIVNPASERNKALHYAVVNGKMNIVKILLSDSRVKPDKEFYYYLGIGLQGMHAEAIKTFFADSSLDSSLKAQLFLMGVKKDYEEGKALYQDPSIKMAIKSDTSLKENYDRIIYYAVLFHVYDLLEELTRLDGGFSLSFIQMIQKFLEEYPLVGTKTCDALEETLREKTIKKIFLCGELGLFSDIKNTINKDLVSVTFQAAP